MDEHASAGTVQGSDDLRTHAPRASGDENHFAVERSAEMPPCAGTIPDCPPCGYIGRAPPIGAAPDVKEVVLSEEELEHAARMHERLNAEIQAAGGWIGFERYMDIALYAPGLGYYSAGARKLGMGGDFVTAPEVSNLFGACLAIQCADVLERLSDGSILEIGAGTGALAADILMRLESLDRLPARYLILDVSADLKDRQRRTLEERVPHLAHYAAWTQSPPAEPFDGVISPTRSSMRCPWRAFAGTASVARRWE